MSDALWQVTIAKYGRRATVRSDVYLNHHLYGEPDGPIGMDYFVWVIRNARRTILVDTGFSAHGGAVRGRDTVQTPDELFERLDVGEQPTVLITHAHYDHIGNLDRFPGAPVVLARREFEFWTGPLRRKPLFHHSVEETELDHLARVVADGRATLFDGAYQVAPGVELLEVGGHTPGQSVVTVATSAGPVLLASDAVHYYEEYEREMPFTSVADLVGMYTAFGRIRSLVDAGEVEHVVAGHDPSTLARFGAGPDALTATIGELP
ncbi:N-acyl homoserine lactonase family protein [Cryptosporangium sp. NPDC051539]|uniref:N-acyl homoserine lactonase family protein n=1 Tax=Cryptosporangium sp. NPDC051539 TaxID=3363962 RepID=UPI0037AAFF13